MAYFYAQHIKTANTKAEITFDYNDFKSLTLVNKHATAAVTLDLYLVDQTGTALRQADDYEYDATPTEVNLSAGYAITTDSLAVNVDGATFTDATCDYNNDPTIAHDDDDGAIKVGMVVSGTGIPTGSTVASVTSDTSFELSASTTGGSVTNGTLTFFPTDIFLNEKVWLSNGTLIGTCTAVGSTTAITFGDGIVYPLTDNDDLYTGARFHILNNVVIPNGASLRLDGEDINFHSDNYKLYVNMNQTDGLDTILRR